MHINYRYLVDFVINNKRDQSNVLDYGCGDGKVIDLLIDENINVYGAEVFQYGDFRKKSIVEKGYLNSIVHEIDIENNNTLFKDNFFDLIVSNQVFEHIEHYDLVLKEFDRISTNDVKILSIFPIQDSYYEGHLHIPLAHRFREYPRFRIGMVAMFKIFGMGRNKAQVETNNPFEWAKKNCEWVDEFTFYQSKASVVNKFSVYFPNIEFIEMDYLIYRLEKSDSKKLLAIARMMTKYSFLRSIAIFIFRRRVGIVFTAKRTSYDG